MKRFHGGLSLVAGLGVLMLGSAASAQGSPAGGSSQDMPAEQQGSQAPQSQQGQRSQQGQQQGLRQGAMGSQQGAPQGAGGQPIGCEPFVLAPLETSAGAGQGAGAGPTGQRAPGIGAGAGSVEEMGGGGGEPCRVDTSNATPAPVPQYWLADASLFVANAANAARTLAKEQPLAVQAPSVLGNQAQFLLASTNRALSSLASLQAAAEATNPRAVSEIRIAIDHLNAAKGQASLVLEAANGGTFGQGHQSAMRSAHEQLQAAEKAIQAAGRAYGVVSGPGRGTPGAGTRGGGGTPAPGGGTPGGGTQGGESPR